MATISATFSGRTMYKATMVVSMQSQDVANNRSFVLLTLYIDDPTGYGSWTATPMSWSAKVGPNNYGGSITYDFRNYSRLYQYNASGLWVTHNADGSLTLPFSFSFADGTTIGRASSSGSVTLPAIPRASVPTFSPSSSLTAGQQTQIQFHRASASFTHTVTYSFQGQTGTIATKTNIADYNWTPPMSLLNAIPNSTTGSGSITTTTYSGSTEVGSKVTNFTLNAPSSVVPTIGGITLSDGNAAVSSAIGAYVQNASTLKWTVTGGAGAYGSTIKTTQITIEGVTQSGTTGTSAVLANSGTVTATARVTDSRGRVATHTANVTVMAYEPPKITSFIARRALSNGTLSSDGTYIRIDVVATLSSLMVGGVEKNAGTRTVKTLDRLTGVWTDKGTAAIPLNYTGAPSSSGYPIDKAFDARIEINDKLSSSAAQTTVATSFVLMHWAKGGIGVGKYWNAGALDVGGDIYQNGHLQPQNYYRIKNNTACYMRIATLDGGSADLGAEVNLRAIGGNRYTARDRPTSFVAMAQRGAGGITLVETVLNPSTATSFSPTYYYKKISDFVFELWVQFPAYAMDYTVEAQTTWRATMTWDQDLTTTAPAGLVAAEVKALWPSASQAEVDAGTDPNKTVTPATLRNSKNIPWAMAAGVANLPAIAAGQTGSTTVTLPSGRFSQAPLITMTPRTSVPHQRASGDFARSATSFSIIQHNGAGSAGFAGVNWIAVQMSSGNSSG